MAILKFTNILHCKTLEKFPKLGFENVPSVNPAAGIHGWLGPADPIWKKTLTNVGPFRWICPTEESQRNVFISHFLLSPPLSTIYLIEPSFSLQLPAGWPDWPNFRLLGDRLLWLQGRVSRKKLSRKKLSREKLSFLNCRAKNCRVKKCRFYNMLPLNIVAMANCRFLKLPLFKIAAF
jgi:hypothetical protein